MSRDEQFQDWYFRYRYLLKNRRHKKGKQRFLQALVSDLIAMRQDVQVMAYNEKTYHSRNVYVGDITQAEKIICTHYDTPPSYLGKYVLFDKFEQRKRTLQALALGILLMLVMGAGLLALYRHVNTGDFDLTQPVTLLWVLIFALYFALFGKVSKGLASRHAFFRNTSSILLMLSLMRQVTDQKVAYAFIDDGCFGTGGLDVIQQSARPNCDIVYLDCLGTDLPIHQIKTNGIDYLFSAREGKGKDHVTYYLNQKDLKQKQISQSHFDAVINRLVEA